ncbi:hypothetical protein K502DRAFT_366825 [Neoconidiobolus thromboides FSU 785]|nr:hypothetical protein K502DRAFT_366825 [Neoconidiobolus thromboides FSU 785]
MNIITLTTETSFNEEIILPKQQPWIPDDQLFFHQYKIKAADKTWQILDKEDCLLYTMTNNKSTGCILLNKESLKICKLSPRGILKSGYWIEVIAQCKQFKKITMKQITKKSCLMCFQIKFTDFNNQQLVFKWICYSPKKWILTQVSHQKKSTVLGLFDFNENLLSFHPALGPSFTTIFCLSIFFISNNHINMLDALGITSLDLSLI